MLEFQKLPFFSWIYLNFPNKNPNKKRRKEYKKSCCNNNFLRNAKSWRYQEINWFFLISFAKNMNVMSSWNLLNNLKKVMIFYFAWNLKHQKFSSLFFSPLFTAQSLFSFVPRYHTTIMYWINNHDDNLFFVSLLPLYCGSTTEHKHTRKLNNTEFFPIQVQHS